MAAGWPCRERVVELGEIKPGADAMVSGSLGGSDIVSPTNGRFVSFLKKVPAPGNPATYREMGPGRR